MAQHTATITCELSMPDDSCELMADVSFNVSPYRPARGPSYASGGEPAEGGDVEDLTVDRLYWIEVKKRWSTVAGDPPQFDPITHDVDCPDWLEDMICRGADLSALAEGAAQDAEGDAADYKYERRRDEAMEDRT